MLGPILAWEIRLVIAVVVEPWITYFSSDHLVLIKYGFLVIWFKHFSFVKHFSFLSVVLYMTLINLHWKSHFSKIYSLLKFKLFCPSGLTIVVLHLTLKLGKFFAHSFSRYNCLKARATSRRQCTFYHEVPRSSWYSFYQPRKDERLSWPWRHPLVLNTGLLDWESSALT